MASYDGAISIHRALACCFIDTPFEHWFIELSSIL
jgi:hypothetical protein